MSSHTEGTQVALRGPGNTGSAVARRPATALKPAVYDVDAERAQAVAAESGLTAAAAVAQLAGADVVVLLPASARASRSRW